MIYSVTAFCLYRDKKWYIYKPILYFLIYIIVNSLIKALIIKSVDSAYFNSILEKIASLMVIVSISSSGIDENQLYKKWKIVSIPVLVGILYQSFQVYILKNTVSPIAILPISSQMARTWRNESIRPSSLFPEPAAYVWFMLPLMYLAIKRRNYGFAIIITLGIFLSTSTTGILLSLLVWFVFAISNSMSKKQKAFAIVVVAIFVFLISSLSVFNFAKGKIINTDIESSFRLGYGFKIMSTVPRNQWLFGVPYSSVASYIINSRNVPNSWYDISIPYFSYVNSFCQNFIEYGLIGTLLYFYLFFSIYKFKNKSIRPLLFAAFGSIWGQSVSLGTGIFIVQFGVMIALDENKKFSKNFITLYKERLSHENCCGYNSLCQ